MRGRKMSAASRRSTMRSRDGRSAASGEKRRALSRTDHHELGGAEPQIDGVEQRHVHEEILHRVRGDRSEQPVGLVRATA